MKNLILTIILLMVFTVVKAKRDSSLLAQSVIGVETGVLINSFSTNSKFYDYHSSLSMETLGTALILSYRNSNRTKVSFGLNIGILNKGTDEFSEFNSIRVVPSIVTKHLLLEASINYKPIKGKFSPYLNIGVGENILLSSKMTYQNYPTPSEDINTFKLTRSPILGLRSSIGMERNFKSLNVAVGFSILSDINKIGYFNSGFFIVDYRSVSYFFSVKISKNFNK